MSYRALLTGVSGLKAHQTRLDVVAANIANVNTIGYRGSRVLFQDLFSQTLRGSSAPVGDFGGTNALQVGLGVRVASIDAKFDQGSLITTGVSSDLAVQGNGFFVLTDGRRTGYTRDGSFTLNNQGLLIEPANGMRVQGFLVASDGTIDTNSPPSDIAIPVGGTAIVRATENANLVGNLNSDAAAGEVVVRTLQVFDSLGTARNVIITFTKGASPSNNWDYDVAFDGTSVTTGTLNFSSSGTLDPLVGANAPTVTIPAALLSAGGDSAPAPLVFTVNMVEVTHLALGTQTNQGVVSAQPSTVAMRSQDGFELGTLESFNIGNNGEINGVFTNGLTRTIAQVALATFANNGGLSREGDNLFIETPASGVAQVGTPASGGRGIVTGGTLENSNIDLGTEFSDLIVTQRGFQANARTVTAADTILQETVNLIR
jgi:flagellar hook protein FlgE